MAQALGTNGKKRPEACTSKRNVGCKPHFVTLHSHFFFNHVRALPFAVQTLVLVSPSVPNSRDKRDLEKGNVCAWGGQAPSAFTAVILCIMVLALILLVSVLGGQGQCLLFCVPKVST